MRIIKASNIKGNFFGGLPYNVSWDFGVGADPSRLIVSVVSENGQYANPKLSFETTETVSIGKFNFEGYLVNFSFTKSPDRKLLQLEYLDKAADLNKFFVGLNKKHGDKTNQVFKNLILVGKEYHPCDTNQDSMIDYQEGNTRNIDYCDPCPFMPTDKYDFSCNAVMSDFAIFEVYYTFNELIDKVRSATGLVFDTTDANIEKKKKFKSRHVGNLKNVLDSWCSDLGLAYFWDPFDKKFIFIGREKPIRIPELSIFEQMEDVIDLNHGESIENTFSRGVIGTFEKEGRIEEYQCKRETREIVKCFNVGDLYDAETQNPFPTKNKDTAKLWSDIKELTVAVSYLGQPARNAFLWFWVYGNLDGEAVEKIVVPYSAGKESDENNEGKILTMLGNMTIRDVYYPKHRDTDRVRYAKWQECLRILPKSERDRITREDANSEGTFNYDNPSVYFLVAEVNEDLARRDAETDENLAKNFLGKYWYKKFKAKIPGATNSNSQVSVETPEGSAQWYPVDSDLTTINLFNFEHDEKSVLGKIVTDINKDKKENELEAVKNREAAKNFNQTINTLRNYHSFILLERDGKWFVPPGSPNSLQWYDKLFEWFKDSSPQVLGDNNGRPDRLATIHPESRKNSNIKLFVCRARKDFDVKFEVRDEHPLEPKERKEKELETQDILGNTVVQKKGRWGLNGNKYVEITLPDPKGIKLGCPVQAFANNQFLKGSVGGTKESSEGLGGAISNPDLDGDEGFLVFVTSNASFPKVLPKIQYQYTENPQSTNVAKVDYLLSSVEEANINLIRGSKKECIVKKKDFEKYAKDFFEFSNYEMKEPQKKISFKSAGAFPEQYKAAQGLASVQISVDDNGVFTSYSFEDRIIQPPSDEFIQSYLRDLYQKKPSINYLQAVNQDSYNLINKTAGIIRSN